MLYQPQNTAEIPYAFTEGHIGRMVSTLQPGHHAYRSMSVTKHRH